MQKKNFIGFKDRVLLHLLRFEKEVFENIHGNSVDGSYKDFLIHLTQDGIADGVGTKQSTIYKELQTLRLPTLEGEEPLIQIIDKVHIPGKKRVCSIYYLTQYGSDIASQKRTYLENKNIEVKYKTPKDNKVITIGELANRLIKDGYKSDTFGALLGIASFITPDGIVDWQDLIETQKPSIKPIMSEEKNKSAEASASMVMNPYFNRIAIKDPKYFFGRKEEIQYILSLLRNTQSCSIVGSRRIGKSSLINYISNPEHLQNYDLNPNDYIFVPIDLEGLGELTQSEFFTMIIGELRNKTTNNELRKQMEEILSKGNIRFLDLKSILQDITSQSKNVVFLFDEFELITINKNLDTNFFSGLRNLANNFNVCYITASYVPLLKLTLSKETLGSPFFNFFTQVNLTLMDEKDVNKLIMKPAQECGIEFNDNIVEFITTTAGRHPFFIQMLCYHIFNWLIDNKSISESDFQKISNKFVFEAMPHFQYFWDHLSKEEQQFLIIINKEGNIENQTQFQPIIISLKTKALVTVGVDGIQVFSESFKHFILTLEKDSLPKFNKKHLLKTSDDQFKDEIDIRKEGLKDNQDIIIDWGNNYFVDEDVLDVSVRFFNEITHHDIPGLFITRTPSEKAEEKWKLLDSKIIWLCSRSGRDTLTPALEKISHKIHEFVHQEKQSVILLDGIEYIVNNNDFLKTLSLMDNIKEIIGINKSIMIFPLSSTIFSEKEMALLGKNSIRIPKNAAFNKSKLENKE